jgi:tripartite-type tricarboxylate transporter receptor subunit TctC
MRFVLAMVGLCLLASTSVAQPYPSKQIRMIAPFAPGGGTDFIARVAAQGLSGTLGQQVIVDNRPGAGGALGAELAVKSPPDGYTLLLIAGSYTVNPLVQKLSFDPVADITPIIQMSQGPFVVVVNPALPARNWKELAALMRAKPGALDYASSGVGSITHLATEMVFAVAGLRSNHVPYKGTGPAVTDLLGGHVQLMLGSVAAVTPQVRGGKLRALAVTTAKRVEALKDVPTLAELGLKNIDIILWHGVVGPRNLPRPIVERLNGDLNRLLQTKELQERLAQEGVSAAGGTPEAFGTRIRNEIELWRKTVQDLKLKLDGA